jgi:hypothetical protein
VSTILGLLLLGALIVMLVAVIVAPIWMIHNWMTDTLWHDFNCVCQRCKDKIVSDEVKRRERWRFREETQKAVDEMERAAKGRP